MTRFYHMTKTSRRPVPLENLAYVSALLVYFLLEQLDETMSSAWIRSILLVLSLFPMFKAQLGDCKRIYVIWDVLSSLILKDP
jgi:hypothetical protein